MDTAQICRNYRDVLVPKNIPSLDLAAWPTVHQRRRYRDMHRGGLPHVEGSALSKSCKKRHYGTLRPASDRQETEIHAYQN